MPVQDRRRWDFSIIDDEFTRDHRLSPSDRSAYLSIVMHARITGMTDEPAGVLMSDASIESPETWRHCRATLADLGYIKVTDRGPQRPPQIDLLPVAKARQPLATPQKMTTTGRAPSVPPSGGGNLGTTPQDSTSVLDSGDSEEGEKTALPGGKKSGERKPNWLKTEADFQAERKARGEG